MQWKSFRKVAFAIGKGSGRFQDLEDSGSQARLGLRSFETSRSFGRNPQVSKNSPPEQISPLNPGKWSFPEPSADEPDEKPKNNRTTLIIG